MSITINLAETTCPNCGAEGSARRAWDVPEEAPGLGDPEGTPVRYRFDKRRGYIRCHPDHGGCGHRFTGEELAAELARQNPDVSLEAAERACRPDGTWPEGGAR